MVVCVPRINPKTSPGLKANPPNSSPSTSNLRTLKGKPNLEAKGRLTLLQNHTIDWRILNEFLIDS